MYKVKMSMPKEKFLSLDEKDRPQVEVEENGNVVWFKTLKFARDKGSAIDFVIMEKMTEMPQRIVYVDKRILDAVTRNRSLNLIFGDFEATRKALRPFTDKTLWFKGIGFYEIDGVNIRKLMGTYDYAFTLDDIKYEIIDTNAS